MWSRLSTLIHKGTHLHHSVRFGVKDLEKPDDVLAGQTQKDLLTSAASETAPVSVKSNLIFSAAMNRYLALSRDMTLLGSQTTG